MVKTSRDFKTLGKKKWLFWKFYWKSFQTRSKNRKANKSTRANAPVNSHLTIVQFKSVQSLSHVRLFATIMNPSMPGLPVHHHTPEFTQTHVHRVSDAIQPSHPLSSPSPPAPIPPSITVFSNESTLCMRWPKYWSFSFSIIPSKKSQGWSPSEWTGWISLQSKTLSRVFSNTTVQKHQFFRAQLSSQSNSHIHTWPLEKP